MNSGYLKNYSLIIADGFESRIPRYNCKKRFLFRCSEVYRLNHESEYFDSKIDKLFGNNIYSEEKIIRAFGQMLLEEADRLQSLMNRRLKDMLEKDETLINNYNLS